MNISVNTSDRGQLKIYENMWELEYQLAEYIADLSEAAVKERGFFAIALSGGSLISMMGQLCKSPYHVTIDWDKWYVFWVDERVEGKKHPDSNYKLANDLLLSKLLVNPSHLYSIKNPPSAEDAAEAYQHSLSDRVRSRKVAFCKISDCPKFDLILLDMGIDGHIASLFPNHKALDEKDEWVTYLTDSPEPPPERITFTLPVINSASNVAVVVAGSNKAEAVHLAIDDVDGPLIPARKVKPINGKLVWFLDKLASSKLDGVRFEEQTWSCLM